MCGIVYLKRNDKHSPIKPLLARYTQQKGRGTEGFGFVAVKDGEVIGFERDTTEDGITKKMQKYSDSSEILFHHRFPTSTGNVEECAHPIFVSNNLLKSDYYFVHNGVIGNAYDLRKEHELMGFEYTTALELISGYRKKNKHKKDGRPNYVEVTKEVFNDTESLAIEFALFNEGIKPEIEAKGTIAFVCYEVEKGGNKIKAIHYGRNMGNPLNIYRSHGMLVLSSQSTDQGSQEVAPFKCLTIKYPQKDQPGALLSRDIALGWTGKSKPTTDNRSSWQGPAKHSLGFDTTQVFNSYGIEDDIDDDSPREAPFTGDNSSRSLVLIPSNFQCPHGTNVADPNEFCLKCVSGGGKPKEVPSPYVTVTMDYVCCYCDNRVDKHGDKRWDFVLKRYLHTSCYYKRKTKVNNGGNADGYVWTSQRDNFVKALQIPKDAKDGDEMVERRIDDLEQELSDLEREREERRIEQDAVEKDGGDGAISAWYQIGTEIEDIDKKITRLKHGIAMSYKLINREI